MSKSKVSEATKSLGKMRKVIGKRPNGSLRVSFIYDEVPSMTEQHGRQEADINYLVAKYKPDELANYLMQRFARKQPLPDLNSGYDYSRELTKQEALNVVADVRREYMDLPEDVRAHFKSPSQFMKFIDKPGQLENLVKKGFMTQEKANAFLKSLEPVTPAPTDVDRIVAAIEKQRESTEGKKD